jgi:hypothetical protein
VEHVLDCAKENPGVSKRQRVTELNVAKRLSVECYMSSCCANTIYSKSRVSSLLVAQHDRLCASALFSADHSFLLSVLFPDVAGFGRDGIINHNYHQWAEVYSHLDSRNSSALMLGQVLLVSVW